MWKKKTLHRLQCETEQSNDLQGVGAAHAHTPEKGVSLTTCVALVTFDVEVVVRAAQEKEEKRNAKNQNNLRSPGSFGFEIQGLGFSVQSLGLGVSRARMVNICHHLMLVLRLGRVVKREETADQIQREMVWEGS